VCSVDEMASRIGNHFHSYYAPFKVDSDGSHEYSSSTIKRIKKCIIKQEMVKYGGCDPLGTPQIIGVDVANIAKWPGGKLAQGIVFEMSP